jgi:Domain of unknown function DUF11
MFKNGNNLCGKYCGSIRYSSRRFDVICKSNIPLNIIKNLVIFAIMFASLGAAARDDGLTDYVTVPVGSYIIDPSPTTVIGGTRPYGAVYDLVTNQTIPVFWGINPTKLKDGNDFTISGITYRSGAFIISAEYVTPAVLARITFWRGQGVTINGPITAAASNIPIYDKITSLPKTVLDSDNLGLSSHFFIDASIPATAYRTGLPSSLTACDDFYAMPHADPTVATHTNLRPFNARGGYIWAGCHAVSVLESLNDPLTVAPLDFNFLSSTGLVHYQNPGHSDGVAPYIYTTNGGDPIMQFLGDLGPATENGSEQIYLPANPGSWRPTTKVLMWDDPFPQVPSLSPGLAAKLVYGRGFGVSTNGLVMYEGGHNHDGNTAANVAAKRAFLNLWLLAGIESRPELVVSGLSAPIVAGTTVNLSANVTGGTPGYSYQWSSSCGGTFSASTSSSTTFAAPLLAVGTSCVVTINVVDSCSRRNFLATTFTVNPVPPKLTITKTASQAPLVVGQTGQFYTINIAVANNVTTAAITLADVLPTGIATSGNITATGGILSGCPGAGATSLAGCSIASGAAVGNIVIIVPVTVSLSAIDGSINSVTATGGGDPLCTGVAPACTGSVTSPIKSTTVTLRKVWLDASINDAVTVSATGLANLLSVADTANDIDASAAQVVLAGNVLTLSELITAGVSTNYVSTLACTGTAGLTGSTLTVGAADMSIVCTYTNKNILVALTITKTDSKAETISGGNNDYVLSVSNAGPAAADGSVVTDVPGVGITCPASNTVTCTTTGVGGAVCPAGSLTFANLTTGIPLATFPANSGFSFAYTCNVN